jgi:hypothetical protein
MVRLTLLFALGLGWGFAVHDAGDLMTSGNGREGLMKKNTWIFYY